MLGNVYEWVDHPGDGQGAATGNIATDGIYVDPVGDRMVGFMDLRGGSYRKSGCDSRYASHNGFHPYGMRADAGFRPVRTILEK